MNWAPVFSLLSTDEHGLTKVRAVMTSNFSALRSFFFELISLQGNDMHLLDLPLLTRVLKKYEAGGTLHIEEAVAQEK